MQYTLLLLLLVGCAKPGSNFNVTLPVSTKAEVVQEQAEARVEAAAEDVRSELHKLPDFLAVPLLKDDVSPKDGILISPRNAAEASLNAAEARRLSTENRVITQLKHKEDSLNDAYVKKLEDDLETCKNKSWWDNHGIETMLGAGVAAGILLSLGVFSASVKIAAP